MKKNLNKKLVLNKHTVASLNAEQMQALHGGLVDDTYGTGCNGNCLGSGPGACGGGGGTGSGGTNGCQGGVVTVVVHSTTPYC